MFTIVNTSNANVSKPLNVKKLQSKRGEKNMVKFPELEKIMAVTKTSRIKLSEIIEKYPAAVTNKLNGKTEFKQSEMVAIVNYFKNLAVDNPDLSVYFPVITTDKIFYENVHYSEQGA